MTLEKSPAKRTKQAQEAEQRTLAVQNEKKVNTVSRAEGEDPSFKYFVDLPKWEEEKILLGSDTKRKISIGKGCTNEKFIELAFNYEIKRAKHKKGDRHSYQYKRDGEKKTWRGENNGNIQTGLGSLLAYLQKID